MYSLLVRDALTAGKVLAALEKVDISNVSLEKSEYSKAKELITELKSRAILKAKEYAQSMVEPINQKVGAVIFISDINSNTNHLQGRAAGIRIRGASSIYGNRASGPIAIEFNKMKFTTRINVKFKIE